MSKYSMTSMLAVISLLATIGVAQAADTPTNSFNLLFKEFEQNGGKVEYLGNSYGMDGWLLVNKQGNVQYAYTNEKGATLMGVMFSPTGEIETRKQMEKYQIVKFGSQNALTNLGPTADKTELIYSNFEKSSWIQYGHNDAPYVYMTISLDSQKSLALINKLQPNIDKGQIAIRIIPIATAEESYYSAARLFSAPKPEEALAAYIAKGDDSLFKHVEISETSFNKLDINANLAKESSIKGVPLIIYRRPYDGKITAISGVPENTLMLLSEVQRTTEQQKAFDAAKSAPKIVPDAASAVAPAKALDKAVKAPEATVEKGKAKAK